MLNSDYRPSTFAEVRGQELPITVLKAIAKLPNTVRSIVLQGQFGTGKTTLARIFAKAVNCDSFVHTGEVCNKCKGCTEAMRPNSQTYYEFDTTRIGSVDAVRSITERFNTYTTRDRRVIVWDEAHAASRQALTALLKVLEDGVPNTYFIFATTESLLNTIMSRSIVIEFNLIVDAEVAARVRDVAEKEAITLTDEQLAIIVDKANGHLRNALSLLEYFRIGGEAVLTSPYKTLCRYFKQVFCREDVNNTVIELVSNYTLVDLNNSLSDFICNCFKANGEFEIKVKDNNLHRRIFKHFYTPEIQMAMKTDKGFYTALLLFNETF